MTAEPAPQPSDSGGVDPAVLARARIRVHGPVPVAASTMTHPGTRLLHDTGDRAWLLARTPDDALPSLLEEYDLALLPVERPGETRRALAAALRCCWTDLDDAPWPGQAAPLASVTQVFVRLARGDADLLGRWALGALRRLHESAWLQLDESRATVRLGPRLATWPEPSLGPLRDLVRRLPTPDRPETDLPGTELDR